MIAFVVTVYKESEQQVGDLIRRIHSLYPESEIVVCFDGVPGYDLIDVKAVMKWPEHLKVSQYGGLWTHQWMTDALKNTAAPYIVKLDPGSQLLKPLEYYPSVSSIFGDIWEADMGDGRLQIVASGGVIGYASEIMREIVTGGWMLDKAYISNLRFRAHNDIMVGHMIKARNLPHFKHPEFVCGRKPSPDTSFYHP